MGGAYNIKVQELKSQNLEEDELEKKLELLKVSNKYICSYDHIRITFVLFVHDDLIYCYRNHTPSCHRRKKEEYMTGAWPEQKIQTNSFGRSRLT